MALFLGRAIGGLSAYTPAACGSERFKDVPCDFSTPGHSPSASYKAIEYIADAAHNAIHLQITKGCGDGTNYCPNDLCRRDEMAAFLSRAFLNMD